MKKGPPHIAVITPTGISVGARSVRARVSASTRYILPDSPAAGKSSLWSEPIIILIR